MQPTVALVKAEIPLKVEETILEEGDVACEEPALEEPALEEPALEEPMDYEVPPAGPRKEEPIEKPYEDEPVPWEGSEEEEREEGEESDEPERERPKKKARTSIPKGTKPNSELKSAKPISELYCDKCGKYWLDERSLEKHIAKRHAKRFYCSQCPVSFVDRYDHPLKSTPYRSRYLAPLSHFGGGWRFTFRCWRLSVLVVAGLSCSRTSRPPTPRARVRGAACGAPCPPPRVRAPVARPKGSLRSCTLALTAPRCFR